MSALDDDLNMPVGLAAVAELLKQVNELAERAKTKKGQLPRLGVAAALRGFDVLGRVFGLGCDDPAALLARIANAPRHPAWAARTRRRPPNRRARGHATRATSRVPTRSATRSPRAASS